MTYYRGHRRCEKCGRYRIGSRIYRNYPIIPPKRSEKPRSIEILVPTKSPVPEPVPKPVPEPVLKPVLEPAPEPVPEPELPAVVKEVHFEPAVPKSATETALTEIIKLVGSKGIGDNLDNSLTQANMDIAMLFVMRGYDLPDDQFEIFKEMSEEADQCCLKHFLKRELGY